MTPVDRTRFFSMARKALGALSQSQVDGIEALLLTQPSGAWRDSQSPLGGSGRGASWPPARPRLKNQDGLWHPKESCGPHRQLPTRSDAGSWPAPATSPSGSCLARSFRRCRSDQGTCRSAAAPYRQRMWRTIPTVHRRESPYRGTYRQGPCWGCCSAAASTSTQGKRGTETERAPSSNTAPGAGWNVAPPRSYRSRHFCRFADCSCVCAAPRHTSTRTASAVAGSAQPSAIARPLPTSQIAALPGRSFSAFLGLRVG